MDDNYLIWHSGLKPTSFSNYLPWTITDNLKIWCYNNLKISCSKYAALTSPSTISLVLLAFLPRFLSSLLLFLISSVQPPSFLIFWPQKGHYNCSLHGFPVKIFSNLSSQSVRHLTTHPSPLLWILDLVSSQVTLNFSYSKLSHSPLPTVLPQAGSFLKESSFLYPKFHHYKSASFLPQFTKITPLICILRS